MQSFVTETEQCKQTDRMHLSSFFVFAKVLYVHLATRKSTDLCSCMTTVSKFHSAVSSQKLVLRVFCSSFSFRIDMSLC